MKERGERLITGLIKTDGRTQTETSVPKELFLLRGQRKKSWRKGFSRKSGLYQVGGGGGGTVLVSYGNEESANLDPLLLLNGRKKKYKKKGISGSLGWIPKGSDEGGRLARKGATPHPHSDTSRGWLGDPSLGFWKTRRNPERRA